MKNKKIRGKIHWYYAVRVVVGIVAIAIALWPKPVLEGENYIKEQDQKSTDELAGTLANRRSAELTAASANEQMSIYDLFDSYAILGDSRAVRFQNSLDPSRVMADIGVKITNIDNYLSTLQSLQPRVIYTFYGLNDIHSNLNGLEGGYEKIVTDELKKVAEVCPQSKIIALSILPVQNDDAMNEQVAIYNEALKKACEQNGWTYLDCTDLVHDEYYEPDGEHFSESLYPLLAERMYSAQEDRP